MSRLHLTPDQTGLEITRAGAPNLSIHPMWLRERCTHEHCVDATTQQRLYNPSDLDPAVAINHIAMPSPGRFTVTFSDGQTGNFLESDIVDEFNAQANPAPIAWNANGPAPATVDWNSLGCTATKRAGLADFLAYGYIVLRRVPATHGAVLQAARHFGYPRETNFGLLFDVHSIPAATDLAYTALPLDLHTDNPYRAPVPGIQLLHCLTNETPGGLSTLADGRAVAETLRAAAPEAFAALTTTPVRFRYTDATCELTSVAPLIETDRTGAFTAINYSPRLDYVPLQDPASLTRFYNARRQFAALLKSPNFERRFRLEDGDLLMFDNRRLLHGRTGFDPATGRRHLQGCYIDIDAVRSEYRILQRQPV